MTTINSFSGDNAFLSNFYPSPVLFDKILYPTSEHAYVAHKTTNKSVRQFISEDNTLDTPGKVKRYGRSIELREDWDKIKLNVMTCIVYEKFKQNRDLIIKLLDTKDYVLIEGNTWGDTYWGVCNGKGENHLGEILMNLRAHYHCFEDIFRYKEV